MTVIHEKHVKMEFDSETFVHYLPKEKAKEFVLDPPNGYRLRAMSTLEHARTANNLWPYKHNGSLYYLNRLIALNPSIGLFNTDTDELVAWCFRFQSGVLGTLQVKEPFLRKGLGKLVTKAICKKLGELEMDVLALVADTNVASKRTFKALGFEIIDCCYWIKIIPEVPVEWDE